MLSLTLAKLITEYSTS